MIYLFGTEFVRAGHEVCAEQRETDGVSALGRKLQTLLEHLLKGAAVEAARQRQRNGGISIIQAPADTVPSGVDVSASTIPENGQVRRLHQHLHQRVHHLCVEDDGVHHLAELLVVGDAQAGLGDAGVGLQPEPVQPHASEVKHLAVLYCSTIGERRKTGCHPQTDSDGAKLHI